MTNQEFSAAINPLLGRFKNAYNGDVLALIFDEVKNITLLDFKRLIAHLNGSSRFAPMVPDFRKGIMELSIAMTKRMAIVNPDYRPVNEDFVYQVRDNIWANNSYVYIREDSEGKCKFIIKALHPDHPLVIEAKEVMKERIAEIKKHLVDRTYAQFMEQRQSNIKDMKPLKYKPMEGA